MASFLKDGKSDEEFVQLDAQANLSSEVGSANKMSEKLREKLEVLEAEQNAGKNDMKTISDLNKEYVKHMIRADRATTRNLQLLRQKKEREASKQTLMLA